MNRDGFTLLEVLITISIFSVIILTVFGSFRTVFSSIEAVSKSSGVFEAASACLNRMTIDLSGVHVSQYPLYKTPDIDDDPDLFQVKEESVTIGGNAYDRLVFTSFSHIAFNQNPRQGIARIIYYTDIAKDKTIVIRRADHLFPYPDFEPDPKDPVLCEKVLGIEYVYLNTDGEINDTWDSDSEEFEYATPRAIGIKLKIGDDENPKVFQTMVTIPVFRQNKE